MLSLAAAAALLGSSVATFGFAPKIVVTFRGVPVKFGRGFAPYRSQSTVLLPFREMARVVGAVVARSPDGKHVTLSFQSNTVYYEPGHHGYRLNGHRQNMRASSELRNKHLYVPIRLFTDLTAGGVHAELLGLP
jgi:hypothetical protein